MGLNVLIVDDSGTMRSILSKVLRLSGFEVGEIMEAENGVAALELLSREWIDVILLDIHMPVMDGIDLLKKMKSDDIQQNIPIVLVTTEAREERLSEAMELGAKAHVKKPFQPEEIREILNSILGDEYARTDDVGPDAGDF